VAAADVAADVEAVAHVRVAAVERVAAQGGAIMNNASPIARTIRRVRGACTCAHEHDGPADSTVTRFVTDIREA
jgi:hypothetical protein